MFDFVLGILFISIIFFSFCSNLLVLIALLTTPTLQKSSNYFLASLSMADLSVTLLVMIPSAVGELLGWWPFGATACQVFNSLDVTFCTVSILHLSAISIDRYHAIVRCPLRYHVSFDIFTIMIEGMQISEIYLFHFYLFAIKCEADKKHIFCLSLKQPRDAPSSLLSRAGFLVLALDLSLACLGCILQNRHLRWHIGIHRSVSLR